MGRGIQKLSALQVDRLKTPGRYADGGGLYLQITKAGVKSWLFRFMQSGKSREMGLGPIHALGLAEARVRAADCRKQLLAGEDPIEARASARSEAKLTAAKAMPFRQCAEDYIDEHRAEWKNAKHVSQWENTLATYAYPFIGDIPVGSVDTAKVLEVLKPIWTKKTETATRLRGRIETILDAAKAKRLRQGDNPAQWRGHLEHFLPDPGKVATKKHHPALPYDQLPTFMGKLRGVEGVSALCLEFVVLTAARSGEALNATWSEIDEEKALWTVPAERMKAKREHRVPLTNAALAILQKAKELRQEGDYVFPGVRSGRPMSDMSLTMLLRRLHPGITTHGFRSSFRDWAAEVTDFAGEVAEMALAHVVSSKVEAAYRRGDMFDKRRKMMADWAAWCEPREAGKVIPIQQGNAA